jgi:hypothetical protein
MRSISFQRLRIETSNGTDRITGAVAARSQGPDGWRTFHDVSVVAYDDGGERIDATALGDIDGTTGGLKFTLTCERHPERIVIEAAESPRTRSGHSNEGKTQRSNSTVPNIRIVSRSEPMSHRAPEKRPYTNTFTLGVPTTGHGSGKTESGSASRHKRESRAAR